MSQLNQRLNSRIRQLVYKYAESSSRDSEVRLAQLYLFGDESGFISDQPRQSALKWAKELKELLHDFHTSQQTDTDMSSFVNRVRMSFSEVDFPGLTSFEQIDGLTFSLWMHLTYSPSYSPDTIDYLDILESNDTAKIRTIAGSMASRTRLIHRQENEDSTIELVEELQNLLTIAARLLNSKPTTNACLDYVISKSVESELIVLNEQLLNNLSQFRRQNNGAIDSYISIKQERNVWAFFIKNSRNLSLEQVVLESKSLFESDAFKDVAEVKRYIGTWHDGKGNSSGVAHKLRKFDKVKSMRFHRLWEFARIYNDLLDSLRMEASSPAIIASGLERYKSVSKQEPIY